MARSSLLLLLLGGCDLVFGLSGQPEPCDLGSFDSSMPVDIAEADGFSVDWEQTFAVVAARGLMFELPLPAGEPMQIDLGVYMSLGLSLTPEGDALFYTAAIEPMELLGALRSGTAQWRLDAEVPLGTFAGTPSADEFGPRRVLVRVRHNDVDVQEFEDDHGRWVPVGTPHPVEGMFAPNLTPNGLTMVYARQDAIFAAQRESTATWFGEPQPLLTGAFTQPQLLGACRQLYSVWNGTLQRFDR